ncbi:MAG: GIY-YIG nuclease family protein [Candidatus Parcubacteria bacterium]|nr:GIY-YIG nuclease family protein [Candidatus Parcubacteria bacterium]
MFYTYVLQSQKDEKLYIGFSENLKQRILEHNKGLVDATKNRRPLKLVYYEACSDKYSALEREKYFKTGFGRRFLKSRLKLKNLPKLD